MSYNPWPKIIRHHLKTHDLSQSQLADRGDLTAQTVNRWIHQKAVPDPNSIDKLATGMGLSVHELMWRYTCELDAYYRPRVPHLLEPEARNQQRELRERAEALLELDLSGLCHDMRLGLAGLRDVIRHTVSNHEATSSLLETLISRFEDSYEAARKQRS